MTTTNADRKITLIDVPVAEFRKNLSDYLKRVHYGGTQEEPVVIRITKSGKPFGVISSAE